jgi:hypothetical protein
MSARATSNPSLPVAWPLAGSLVVTAAVVAFVCTPPRGDLHSWTAIFSRATLYLLVAACVHALAVWGICRVRNESEEAELPLIWTLIWAAWIAVVWLPLVALLTAERSPWVALVLPLTAVFATLLLKWRAAQVEGEDGASVGGESAATPLQATSLPSTPFQLLDSPFWRLLLPAVGTSVAAQIGVASLASGHAWGAGCLFGAGMVYPLWRWLDRAGESGRTMGRRGWGRTAAGNSAVVWLLLVLALVPFMALYAAGALSSVLGIRAHAATLSGAPRLAKSSSSGYSGIILVQPKKPHEIVVPAPMAAAGSFKEPHVIAFDGAYWYFKQPDTRPAPNARVMQGDPAKKHIFSTDHDPLIMEAHQPLGQKLMLSCCRTLRVDVTNADNVPGTIGLEVLLSDRSSANRLPPVSLGTVVLATSTVSPMPLKRPPVEDKVTFAIPRAARGRGFDEITVRIKPERLRSMAGTQVAIKDFVLQP